MLLKWQVIPVSQCLVPPYYTPRPRPIPSSTARPQPTNNPTNNEGLIVDGGGGSSPCEVFDKHKHRPHNRADQKKLGF